MQLFLVLSVLAWQTPSPLPNPLAGHWAGKITYTRTEDGQTKDKEIIIEDLVIDENLLVSGTFGSPAADSSKTQIGDGKAKITPEGEFDRILLWMANKRTLLCNFHGTVELSKDGQTMTGKKFFVRDLGTSHGNTDDRDCPAKIELHRTKSGAFAPFFLPTHQ